MRKDNFSQSDIHRYRVVFDPEFSPGSSPSGVFCQCYSCRFRQRDIRS